MIGQAWQELPYYTELKAHIERGNFETNKHNLFCYPLLDI